MIRGHVYKVNWTSLGRWWWRSQTKRI